MLGSLKKLCSGSLCEQKSATQIAATDYEYVCSLIDRCIEGGKFSKGMIAAEIGFQDRRLLPEIIDVIACRLQDRISELERKIDEGKTP